MKVLFLILSLSFSFVALAADGTGRPNIVVILSDDQGYLGLTGEYRPGSRGFDEFHGLLGCGAHPYFDLAVEDHPIYRGLGPIKDNGCLTTRLTERGGAKRRGVFVR